MRTTPEIVERFWSKVDLNGPRPPDPWAPIETNCWLWTGSLSRGQGRFYDGTKLPSGWAKATLAHRYAYELLVGPIPEGLTIDHLCRVPHCVRPDHMEPVPKGVNTLRSNAASAVNARKTHCKNGHPLSGDNLRVTKSKRKDKVRQERACWICYRAKYKRDNKRRWAKIKAEREAEQKTAGKGK